MSDLHTELERIKVNLSAVLCDPEGNVVINGSDEDRRIIKESLKEILKIESLIKERLEKAFGDVENEQPTCVCVGVNLPVILEEGDSGSQDCHLPISYLWDKLRTAFGIAGEKEVSQ